MAQNSNQKRVERKSKSDRNMNRAVILLIAGLIAEWYLLMVDRYYVRGGSAMVKWLEYFKWMRWAGLGILAAGVALILLRDRKSWFAHLGAAVAGVGAFLSFTSFLMPFYFPTNVTVLCVFVPVVLVLGIIYLFYQAEFSVQATALTVALFALVFRSRSSTPLVKGFAIFAIAACAALLVCTLLIRKNSGAVRLNGKELRLFPAKMNYTLTLGVLAACIVLVFAALFSADIAFYAVWALAIGAFVLAVNYTIKLM